MNQSQLDHLEDSPEPAAPSKKTKKGRRRRSPVLDFFLGFFGFCLAAFSSYLPFYVYIHSSEFGPPEMEFTGRKDAPAQPPELEILQQRRPLFREVRQAKNADPNVDTVVTGSIDRDDAFTPDLRPAVRSKPDLASVPLRNKDGASNAVEHKSLTLVFATSSRALIRDGNDLVPVAIGSRLPDGSTVKSLSRQQGGWHLLTSENTVLKLVY
jgi:hypothetical protein